MPQEFVFDEPLQGRMAFIATEGEQSLRLHGRQAEIGHLDVLRPNPIQNGKTDTWRCHGRHNCLRACRRGRRLAFRIADFGPTPGSWPRRVGPSRKDIAMVAPTYPKPICVNGRALSGAS